MDWSVDMYLQANQGSEAVSFYTKIGFEKMDTNNYNVLPPAWLNPDCQLYIIYMDDATNKREAVHRHDQDDIPYSEESFLHLYKLSKKFAAV